MINKLDKLARRIRETSKTDIGYVGKLTAVSAAAGSLCGSIRILREQTGGKESADTLLAAAGSAGLAGLLYALICWQVWKVKDNK